VRVLGVVSALHHVGRSNEARTLMDRFVGITNDVGVLAEMIDAGDDSLSWEICRGG
jgi:hypothetical protein